MNYFDQSSVDWLGIAVCKSLNRDPAAMAAQARERFGRDSAPAIVTQKSLVGGLETAPEWISLQTEVVEAVGRRTAFDRIPGRRLVDANIPVSRSAGAATASVVAEGHAIPVSRIAFDWSIPPVQKIGAIVVTSKEALTRGGQRTLKVVANDVETAIAKQTDVVFLSDMSSNATLLNGSGTITTDVAAALEAFVGDLQTASWICDAKTAARLGMTYQSAGVRDSTLLGLPLLVSMGAPIDTDGNGTLMLLDGSRLVVIDSGIDINVSYDGAIEQRTDPTGKTAGAPTTVTTNAFTSLFQSEAAAIRATRRIGWVCSDGAMVTVSGVH